MSQDTSTECPFYVPPFILKLWGSQIGPNELPRDSRVHVYDVYDNELDEVPPIQPGSEARPVFQDLESYSETARLLLVAEQAFYDLEREAEGAVTELMSRAYASGTPTRQTYVHLDRKRLGALRKYLIFLRFRNSAAYRQIVRSLKEPEKKHVHGTIYPAYFPLIIEHRLWVVLRAFISFLEHDIDRPPPHKIRRQIPAVNRVPFEQFPALFDTYCWRLWDAEICVGVSSEEEQEYILPDACFGTLDEGFAEAPDCCDFFFPMFPTFNIYVLGKASDFDIEEEEEDEVDLPLKQALVRIDIGIESASDIHLRNAMILQTYPQRLYFSSLRPVALSISSYDEFRWIQEHQDYSRLKQRCRQKFLQETVTNTLVVKGSVIVTDLTNEVSQMGNGPVCHGAFADVWKAVWNDPVEKRSRKVAVKVLRQIMVQNVKEKLMKRLQTEVVAWHRLCHRNINQLYGIIQFQNSIGMVSTWCDHGNLCNYLKDNFTVDRLDLIIQIASGIDYLHSAQPVVVHGDLKGVNILIDERGYPVLTDFGLSKVIEDMSDTINIGSSFFAGSTRWMAPELILALVEDTGTPPPITTYSDVYAFASVCLEVATGRVPYAHRSNDHAVTVDIIRGVKPSRADKCYIRLKDTEFFWDTLDRCWNQDFDLRPGMKEISRLLESMRCPTPPMASR